MHAELADGIAMPSPGYGIGVIRGWQVDTDEVAEIVHEAIRYRNARIQRACARTSTSRGSG